MDVFFSMYVLRKKCELRTYICSEVQERSEGFLHTDLECTVKILEKARKEHKY